LVSFFGQRSDVRFDPQTLVLLIRNRLFRPLGTIPINARFTSGQLGVREQASAIYLFEETIPVVDLGRLAEEATGPGSGAGPGRGAVAGRGAGHDPVAVRTVE
jgi:hypothetical protein